MEMEKAYDKINWKFLDYMLNGLGFGIRWRKWIAKCYEMAFFQFFSMALPKNICIVIEDCDKEV